MVVAENIHKRYGDLHVLKGIDLSIGSSEIVSIVGPSGAGKTTLLQILGSLDNANSGDVFIKGVNIRKLGERQMARFRNENIGFIFQFHQLLPEFNALENVVMPALIGGKQKGLAEKRAKELLTFLGLGHRFLHKPAELSGGEKQRVAVARALMNEPEVIFADEPTGSLDSQNQKELQELFITLKERFKQTFVIVTHDQELATISDRVIRMRDGLIEN